MTIDNMRDEIITVKYLDAMIIIISFSNEYLTIGTNTDIPDAQNMGDLFIYLYLVFGDHYNNPYREICTFSTICYWNILITRVTLTRRVRSNFSKNVTLFIDKIMITKERCDSAIIGTGVVSWQEGQVRKSVPVPSVMRDWIHWVQM